MATSIKESFRQQAEAISKMYDLLGTEKENQTAYLQVAEVLGLSGHQMMHLKRTLEYLGALKTRVEYGRMVGDKNMSGRTSFWTLTGDPETTTREALRLWSSKTPVYEAKSRADRERRQARRTNGVRDETNFRNHGSQAVGGPVVRYVRDEPAEAIAGPDKNSPFDVLASLRKNEPKALVEAARQYAGRRQLINQKLDELEKAGITVNREEFFRSAQLETVEHLDIISLVLPYIDQLETQVQNKDRIIATTREDLRGMAQLRTEYNNLRESYNKAIRDRVRPVEA